MRQLSLIVTALVVLVLLGGAVAVYAYDSARDDLVADGVSAGGVDIGGLRADEARERLEKELARPLARPLWIRHGSERVRLSAKRARLTADIEGMLQEALEKSRDGNVLSRTIRDLKGDELHAELPPRVSYSKKAVKRLVSSIAMRVNRKPVNAEVAYSGTGVSTVPSKTGTALQARRLERSIAAQLVLPNGRREVRARTRVVQPKTTTDELASKYPTFLTISRDSKQLKLYQNLQLVRTYTVAIGRAGFETPAGLYNIQNKAVNVAWQVPEWGGKLAGQTIPGGAPNNPLKARWLGIYDGAGIHGTEDTGSLGTAASHGCIRMAIPDVIELYDKVAVGSPVYIA